MRDLPQDLGHAAREMARRLEDAGRHAWIVGGAVRDLALGLSPHEIDMATDALPDQVQATFEHTIPIGKAFGTILVLMGAVRVELTTFRADEGYTDARRPDAVTYGSSVEEDARRRDFTCNAMYLDPLRDAFRDPERGLQDLRAGLLRCVGDARARFREDGLRLVRLARFAARFGLTPVEGTLEAARAELDALRGVSAERLLGELEGIFAAPDPARAFQVLRASGVLERWLPELDQIEQRLAALAELGAAPGVARGLALLFDPAPLAAASEEALTGAAQQLERLRPSRALRAQVRAIWELAGEVAALTAGAGSRARKLRAMRRAEWADALRLAAAWCRATGRATGGLLELESERAALAPEQLSPPAWITAADLEAAGLAPGPRWGELLLEAETHRLDGEHATRAQALRWLRDVTSDQEGGNTLRNNQDNG